MKFFEYKKENLERYAKVLGITIMKQSSDYMTAERTQEFLGGLVKTSKLRNITSDCSKKEVKILGLPVIKRDEENNFMTYYLFGKKIKTISLLEEFAKKYSKYFDKKHDDIYILNANSGEAYLTLTYVLDTLLEKFQSKKPLIVATKPYHVDLIKMICPDLPYVFVKNMEIKITGGQFEANGFRFFLMYDITHFKKVEIDIKENELGTHHYFKSILSHFGLEEKDLGMRKINILPEAEESALKKANELGLNLDRFVFLSPEANSCEYCEDELWVTLINEFQNKDYDVFVNLAGEDIKLEGAKDYKTCKLSFAEAFSLAKRAKKIVSLRSGLTEFLVQTGVPMDVLYTKFRQRHLFNDMEIEYVMSGFGMKHLPSYDITHTREINVTELGTQRCLSKTMEGV